MLTERQQRFVDAYRGNGLEAARAAGYTGSDATLKVRASKLLKDPRIADAIEERQRRVLAAADAPEDPALDPKHRAFVDAYLESGNASAAARAAGYAETSAAGQAQRLLARADVRAAIEAGRAKRQAAEIADAREQQVILTKLARDESVEPKDRISAIDKLHKIQRGILPQAARGSAAEPSEKRPKLVIVRNGRGPSEAADG